MKPILLPVVSETAHVFFKATDNYAPEYERTLRCDDMNIKRELMENRSFQPRTSAWLLWATLKPSLSSLATAFSPALAGPHQAPERLRNTLHSRFTCLAGLD